MKKFSWILALLLALSFAFIGCPGDGGEPEPEPIIPDPVTDAPTKADIYLNNDAAFADGVYTISGGGAYKEIAVVFDQSIQGQELEFTFTVSEGTAAFTPARTDLDFSSAADTYGNKGCDSAVYTVSSPYSLTPTKFANVMKINMTGTQGDVEFSEFVVKVNGEAIPLTDKDVEYPNLTIPLPGRVEVTASDFTYEGFVQVVDAVVGVTITPKTNVGAVSNIQYEGADGTEYEKSATIPQAIGKYKVTFDVAETAQYSAATGLEAVEQLVVNSATAGWQEITDFALVERGLNQEDSALLDFDADAGTITIRESTAGKWNAAIKTNITIAEGEQYKIYFNNSGGALYGKLTLKTDSYGNVHDFSGNGSVGDEDTGTLPAGDSEITATIGAGLAGALYIGLSDAAAVGTVITITKVEKWAD